MALLGANLDYTDKDFDSLRLRLFNLIEGAFPEWTEQNVANFGNIIVELFAFVGDVLGFYQDNQANESRITTAQLRRSLLALSKLVGFEAKGQTAATVDLQVVLSAVPVGDVTFEVGDLFRTQEVTNPVIFQNLIQVVIPGGTDPPVATLALENSSGASEAHTSTGKPNQEFTLQSTPFLEGSLSIVASDGLYTVQDSLLDSTATDRHTTVTVDENDRARVRFGNGVNGKIPEGTITFTYKVGGGITGNVLPNTIVRATKSYVDSFANPVVATVTNPEAASGGAERQSVESIREEAPRATRVVNRTVAREDYEINALRVAGVARAVMLTSNEREGIAENQGQLVIVPEGGGAPSTTLKNAVSTLIDTEYPTTLTFIYEVIDPTYLTVNVQATVFLTSSAVASVVDAAIRANLTAFFALRDADGSLNENIDFGYNLDGELPQSSVFNVVRDTTGVRKVGAGPADFLLNGQTTDVELEPYEFPTLGTITLINGDTGSPLV